MEQYQKALKINPDNPRIYLDLAYCYFDLKQYNNTLTYAKTALQKSYTNEDRSRAYQLIGLAYEYAGTFKKLNEKFVQNGIGVVIGEYGAVNKNNLDQRLAYFHSYLKQAKKYNLAACLWDNGQWQVKEGSRDYSEKFGYYNRKEQTWYFPEILEAIIEDSN